MPASPVARRTPPPTIAPVAPDPAERQIADRMVAATTLEHIRKLSEVPRVWGSPAYQAGAEYVVAQLQDSGFDAHIVKSGDPRHPLLNVVAERKGTAPDAERKLVFAGAHL